MRGNINWQVQQIYNESGIKQIGESKHNAKENARNNSSSNIGATWHEIGKKIGIHSYSTADAYRKVWKSLGKFVKTNYKISDMEKIEGKHVQAFLEEKITDNVAHKTFAQYAAACEKLETAMKGFATNKDTGKTYEFTTSIKNTREDAKNLLEKFTGSRAYMHPTKLINSIENHKYQIAAKIQFESGARVSECTYLTEKNLLGFEKDPLTGVEKGKLLIEKAKGGITGNKYISKDTYNKLQKAINISEKGRFEINIAWYRNIIKSVSEKTNQLYTGTHGLRWNFAQERFQEVQRVGGLTYEQALAHVSQEMFHQRPDITEHYLK